MSSAIEVLKCMIEDRKCFCGCSLENSADTEINALDEAIVALEQKDCISHWQPKEYCKQCIDFAFEDGEREGRKQGALEELERIEEAWHHIGSKGVCNYIEKRIKELEEEGVEK